MRGYYVVYCRNRDATFLMTNDELISASVSGEHLDDFTTALQTWGVNEVRKVATMINNQQYATRIIDQVESDRRVMEPF